MQVTHVFKIDNIIRIMSNIIFLNISITFHIYYTKRKTKYVSEKGHRTRLNLEIL